MTTLPVGGNVAVSPAVTGVAPILSREKPPAEEFTLDNSAVPQRSSPNPGSGDAVDLSGMPGQRAYAVGSPGLAYTEDSPGSAYTVGSPGSDYAEGSPGSAYADSGAPGLPGGYRRVAPRDAEDPREKSPTARQAPLSSESGNGAALGAVLGNTFGLAAAGTAGAVQSVNTNLMALNAYRHVTKAHDLLNSSLQKLSSGKRINKAGDDAAGLAMVERLRAQMLGNKQAVRNAQDGISMVQTADGVLGTVHSMLQRMRVLAVQGANDSNGPAERGNLAVEMDTIRAEIGRIGEVTEVLGRKILGDKYVEPADALRIQVGSGATEMETIAITFVDVVDIAKAQLGCIPQDADHAAFQGAIWNIDGQIEVISEARANLGAVMSRFEHTINTLNVTVENLSAARARIEDSDIAMDASNYMRGQILAQTSHAMLSQAIMAPRGVLSLLSAA